MARTEETRIVRSIGDSLVLQALLGRGRESFLPGWGAGRLVVATQSGEPGANGDSFWALHGYGCGHGYGRGHGQGEPYSIDVDELVEVEHREANVDQCRGGVRIDAVRHRIGPCQLPRGSLFTA